MASIITGYEYDIFISYRQKDNKGERWVSEFIESLKEELESTFKEEISVYFDINPSDYLLDTYDVDATLKDKLKCLVFIPVISRTYCDPRSFAWEHEFRAFIEQASKDQFGLKIKLPNGNVTGRVLPVQIHEITAEDKACIEKELGGVLRPVEFVYREPGVNRPLRSNEEHPDNNLNKTFYRNQINKVANAIEEILTGLKKFHSTTLDERKQNHEALKTEEKKDKLREKVKPALPGRVKLIAGISLLVLAIIAVCVVFLIKPGSRNNINAMTVPVTVTNEYGEKEVRRVVKEGYITKLSIFPFVNETNDSSEDWLQYSLFTGIFQDLCQFNYLSITYNQNASHLQEQIKYARTNNSPFFISGTYRISDGVYQITSKLYQTNNGFLKSERTFKGNDLLSTIDSISIQARVDLGISDILLNSSSDLPFREHSTGNLEALRYFAKGLFIESLQLNLYNAIKLDSTFALALYSRAIDNHWYQRSQESARKDISQAMRHRQRLCESDNIYTRIYYYTIFGQLDKAITLLEMQYELHPGNYSLLLELCYIYQENMLLPKLEKAALLLNKLIPDQPDYQILLARSYLLSGQYDKGLELMDELLKQTPEKVEALWMMGEFYLNKNEFEAARRCYQKAILIQPESEKNMSMLIDHISYSQNNPNSVEFLEPFTGSYQFEDSEMTLTSFIHNNHLTIKGGNQAAITNYPVSDNQFTNFDGVNNLTFLKNDQGEVVNAVYHRNGRFQGILWQEDSLILKAMKLLDGDDKNKALFAFREAYTKNKDHYYLANFIRHLEYVLTDDYERERSLQDTYTGKYGEMTILKKNDNLYFEDYQRLIYKILPFSEDQFMTPSFYNQTIRIVREKNLIKGLVILYKDGKKEFFAREK